ncbi:MAG TPA: PAS domain S-box protein, partial [Candidatus Acidoferrales bacterium]
MRVSPGISGDANGPSPIEGQALSPLSLNTNANFRLLFSCHPHPMFVFDRDTLQYLDVNDAAIQNYGYSREEFLRLKISDIRPAEDVPRLMKTLRHHSLAIAAQGVWKHRRKNGELFDVEICSQGIGFGEHNAVLVSAVDITARVAAETQIAEQTASLRAIMENNPIAIVVMDLERRIRMCNPAFQNTFKHQQAEIIGQDLDELLAPEALRSEAQAFSGRAASGETVRANSRRQRSDGTLVDVRIIAVPLMVGGRCTGSFAMYEDITERNQAERARREAEERLRLLFENAVEGIFQASVDGRLLSVNPA